MATYTKRLQKNGNDTNYQVSLTIEETAVNNTNNTSTISYTLKVKKTGGSGYWTNDNDGKCKLTINGVDHPSTDYYYKKYDFRSDTEITMVTGNQTITHNSDGSKSIYCKGYFGDLAGNLGSGTATGTFVLTSIPRASVPTFSDSPAELGEELTITTNRKSNNFTHTLSYIFNDTTTQIATNVGDSTTWTPPLNLAYNITTSTTATCTIVCDTYNGDTLVGTKNVSLELKVPDSVVPGVSIGTITEGNPIVSALNWGVFVQNKSQAVIPVSGITTYNSNIISLGASVNGIPANYVNNEYISNILTTAGTNTAVGSATDMRGRSNTTSKTFNVVAYSNPNISVGEAQRCTSNGTIDSNGTYIKYTIKGSISSVLNHNTASWKLGYKKTTDSTYTYVDISTDYDLGNNYVDVISSFTISASYAYDIKFTATDAFTTTELDTIVDTGFDLLNFNPSGKSMAIGKVSEATALEEKLEVALDTTFTGDVTGGTINFTSSNYHDSSKQDTLVSGTNIKTINNTSLLGSGNISVGGGGTATDVQINGTSITSSNVANIITESAYNASTNKIATKSDIPTTTSQITNNSGYITKSVNNLDNYTLSSSLASVATSGSYSDLSNKPTIPSKVSDLTNDSGFITSSGSITGNASTATTLQNSRTIGIGTGATGTATSFNGSANITIPITETKEAYSVWGGKSLSNNLSPSDMGCIDEFGHNKLAYLPAGCVKAEYTTDGGSTWVDYGLTDNEKIALTTTTGQSVIVGNGTANAKNGTMTTSNMGNFKARVTISTRVFGETYGSLYTAAKKWLLNISNEGATCKCLVEEKTIANYNNNVDTWTTVGTYDVSGWSGWNSIPYIKSFGGSPTQTTQIAVIRFTLYNTAINTAYNCTSRFLDIRLIGATNWTTPSEMAKTGHLYEYSNDKKATFPNSILPKTNNSYALGGTSLKWANVYATTFNGDLTGTASKATGDKNGNDITTTYQPILVSGTNIKTINGASILGTGNISIGGGGTATDVQVNGTSITSGGVANLVTETAYDESTNKIATINDLPTMPSLTNYVKNTDYATSSTGGVVKINGYGLQVSSGTLIGLGKSYADYNNAANQLIVSKQTLENVITGKNLATTSDIPTKLSDFATTLYNDVSGTFGNITLKKDGVNESSANYECLEIEYSNNSTNVPHKTVRLYSPDGKNADLSSEYDNGTNLYIYSENISISGATITRGTQTRWRIATSGNAQRSASNCIYIYKVVGYK